MQFHGAPCKDKASWCVPYLFLLFYFLLPFSLPATKTWAQYPCVTMTTQAHSPCHRCRAGVSQISRPAKQRPQLRPVTTMRDNTGPETPHDNNDAGALAIPGTCHAHFVFPILSSPSLKMRITHGKGHHRTNWATRTRENAGTEKREAKCRTVMFYYAHPFFLTHPTSQYRPCPILCTGMREDAFPMC